MSDTRHMSELSCIALNCTLKPEGPSNTEVLLRQVLDALEGHDVTTDLIRVVTYDVHPGVTS